ncbi:hypothetical protein HELRODRAFT_157035 [Helobdella robusta]|uniref:Bystin n=1 Tax=Helobdella robusta TaxID=6412 RepID=T1EM50_HELRO|nr:hypothetical protein HELRODRAFT_157035 [Helobdella robusta]ESO03517.1 hypothetical protein HELRODRAFT_157035 [Helobdella robusta]
MSTKVGKKRCSNKDPLIKKPVSLVEQIASTSTAHLKTREKKRKRKNEEDDELSALKNLSKETLLSSPKESDEDAGSDDEVDAAAAGYMHPDDEELDEEVKNQFERFFNKPDEKKFADEFAYAISSKRTDIESQCSDVASIEMELNEDVINLFRGVGQVLSSHRSGPVPKPLKIIPKYRIWEKLLELTEPDTWSTAAVLAATRIFVSNLKDRQVARYVKRVLLPRVRNDIKEFKRINPHLYEALMRCMFKSYGFIKGFLLPLCSAEDCTAREATIVSSVLAHCSMKMEHSALAMMEMCQMPYSPAISIFLTTLLDKKFALPYTVVDDLVNYFLRFQSMKRQDLPVLWHQCLLTFAQRYKQDVSSKQKDALIQLLKLCPHKDITPEIMRELVNAKCRDIGVSD